MFAVLAYVLLALQLGLKGAMSFETSWGTVEPRFVLVLAAFVGLWAKPGVAMTSWGVLGILLDLTTTWAVAGSGAESAAAGAGEVAGALGTDGGLTLIGPYALGYLAGGYVLLLLRSVLVREHPLTLGAMAVASGFAAHLIVVAVFTVRAWYEPLAGWSGTHELVIRLGSLLYTGVLAVAVAPVLNRMVTLMGIHVPRTATARGRTKRKRSR